MARPRAILFDVFGTLVDWRGSIAAGLATFGAERGLTANWPAMADAWRGAYKPSMDQVRTNALPWTNLDDLHHTALASLLPRFGIPALNAAEMARLVKLWHTLTPWADSVAGLTALKSHFIIGSLSNGHAALQIALAKHTGFPWDMIFAADMWHHYKPDPQTYLGAARLLGLPPDEVMLAASHNEDLAAARALGLKTGFISRPLEFGAPDHRAQPAQNWEFVASSVTNLADQLISA